MKSRMRLALCILAVGALGSQVAADKVYFKSGDTREGRVEPVPGDPQSIHLVNSVGSIRVGRAIIDRIEETDDATDYCLIGEQFLAIRTYDRAVQMFQKALDVDPEHARAREGMTKARELVEAQKAEARRSLVSRNSDLLAEARTLIGEEKFEQAEERVNTVMNSTPTAEQQSAAQVLRRDLYVAWGLSRLDRLDPETAETHLERALALDPTNEAANNALLQVWEQDPAKKDKVIVAYRNKLKTAPDDMDLNRKLADALLSLNRSEEALEPLDRLQDTSVYRVNNYGQRHEKAMADVAHSRAATGDLDGAIAMYESLVKKFPTADSSPVAYWKYQKQLNALAPDDWAGRAALLSYLTENGMSALAAQEAQLILRNSPDNETATKLLRTAAEDDLKSILDVFNRGEFVLARSMAEGYAEENTRFPDLVARASDIHTKANLEAQRQAKQVREQAREIVAQGDEYLALARRNVELHKSAEENNRSSIVSYKSEGRKYATRAIKAYETALKIDPSLGPLAGGMDVNSKLVDARELLDRINKPTIRIYTPSTNNE